MEKENRNIPYIPDAIILYLENIYPSKIPLNEQTQFQYGMAAGRREVIEHLKTVKNWNDEGNDYVQN